MGHNDATNGKPMPNGKITTPKDAKSTSTPSLLQATSRGPEAIAVLGEIAALFEKANKHGHIYADFGTVLDRKESLELQMTDKISEINQKDARINQLKISIQDNIDAHEVRYADWAAEKGKLQREIAEAKSAAEKKGKNDLKEQEKKFRGQIEGLKNDLISEKRRSAALEAKTQTAKKTETRLKQERDLANTRLEDWEGKLSILKDIPIGTFTADFRQQVQKYMSVMELQFLRDLPDGILADYVRWDNLSKDLNLPFGLPARNSPAAKNARLIAALHTLSLLLSDCMFAPSLIPIGASASRNTKAILLQQVHVDKKWENMMRAMILTSHTRDERDHLDESAADYILGESHRLLGPMVEDPERFRKDLEPVLQGFLSLWKKALLSRTLIHIGLDDGENWDWGEKASFDDVDLPPAPHPQMRFTNLILFPRVFVPGTGEIIDDGLVVWAEQSTIIASETEYHSDRAARQSRVGGGSSVGVPTRRTRRPSSTPSSPVVPRTPGVGGEPFLGARGSDASGSRGSGVS